MIPIRVLRYLASALAAFAVLALIDQMFGELAEKVTALVVGSAVVVIMWLHGRRRPAGERRPYTR